MAINFFLAPVEILNCRIKLKDKNGKLIKFSPAHKLVFFALCKIFNPALRETNKLKVTYQTISDETGLPVATIKKIMPVLALNFPKHFKIINREFGAGYEYEFTYNFTAKSQGRAAGDENNQTKFIQQLNETDFYKWKLFNKLPIQFENKRMRFFKSFLQADIKFWERNINYAIQEMKRNGWQAVPNAWLWRCLEKDYAYNKISTIEKKQINENAAQTLQQKTGINIFEIFNAVK